MNMRRICIASLLAAVSLNTWAAGSAPASAGKSNLDVNGTWNAEVERGSTSTAMQFVFKQEKDKLTGTMSTNGAAPVDISNGKVYKTKITFQVESTMPAMPGMPAPTADQKPQKMITKYEATVDGDSMVIEPQMGGGGSMGGGMPMGGGGGGGRMGGGGMGGGGGGMSGGPPGGGADMGGAPSSGGGMSGAPPSAGGMSGGMGGMRGGMGKITATRAK